MSSFYPSFTGRTLSNSGLVYKDVFDRNKQERLDSRAGYWDHTRVAAVRPDERFTKRTHPSELSSLSAAARFKDFGYKFEQADPAALSGVIPTQSVYRDHHVANHGQARCLCQPTTKSG